MPNFSSYNWSIVGGTHVSTRKCAQIYVLNVSKDSPAVTIHEYVCHYKYYPDYRFGIEDYWARTIQNRLGCLRDTQMELPMSAQRWDCGAFQFWSIFLGWDSERIWKILADFMTLRREYRYFPSYIVILMTPKIPKDPERF